MYLQIRIIDLLDLRHRALRNVRTIWHHAGMSALVRVTKHRLASLVIVASWDAISLISPV